MRYLPFLKLSNGIKQFPMPDLSIIELVEVFWIEDRDLRDTSLARILVDSPALLIWTVSRFLEEVAEAGGLGSVSLEQRLSGVLQAEQSVVVRDNAEPLTSVERLSSEPIARVSCFFSLHDDSGFDFAARVAGRLFLMETACPEVFIPGEFSKPFLAVTQADVNHELLLSKFEATDFAMSEQFKKLNHDWQIELPFFRSGLGGVDARLQRLKTLESNFQHQLETEKIAAMRQLAYGASHDVNNPLANISTRAQALLRDETDPKRRQRLMAIDAQAFRAHDMISNLMTFAKPPKPQFSRVQLRPLVEKVVSRLSSMAEDQQSRVSVDVDYAVYFDVDGEQLTEMLFATTQNSLEALRQGGQVTIRCDWVLGQSELRIRIIDDGPGISPEVRRHVFDPFFSGREAGRGLGFGLSKVWRLMELHHGQVVINNIEEGTCVELVFPVEQDQVSSADIEKTA